MSLLFALCLIGLPLLAVLYDTYYANEITARLNRYVEHLDGRPATITE